MAAEILQNIIILYRRVGVSAPSDDDRSALGLRA
jgi:hypothetical protein